LGTGAKLGQRKYQWFAKYRLPDGRQVQKKIGPAWTERGRPAAGYFTKRTAEDWLRAVLDEARRGTLPGLVKTDVTFAEAADEWLGYIEHDRGRKPSTIAGYRALLRAQLLPTFGEMPIESITTPMIEEWITGPATTISSLSGSPGASSTAAPCGAATTSPWHAPASASSASTICATPSAPA
jgi:hypothetical protein